MEGGSTLLTADDAWFGIENEESSTSSSSSVDGDEESKDSVISVCKRYQKDAYIKRLMSVPASLRQLREAVRGQWSRLVFRRVKKVETTPMQTPHSLVQFLDAPILDGVDSISGTTVLETSKLEGDTIPVSLNGTTCDIAKAREYNDTPLCYEYLGLTGTVDCLAFKYVNRIPSAVGIPILFRSIDACGFDMSQYAFAWFSEEAKNPTLRCIPPPKNALVAGTVEETIDANGHVVARFDKWFYPSTAFVKLYTYVMHDKPRSLNQMRKDNIKTQLDCGWHYSWQTKGSQIAAWTIHEATTYLYSNMTSCDPMALYYFYQVFCCGTIQEWEYSNNISMQTMIERMRFSLFYLLRKQVKQKMRDDKRVELTNANVRVFRLRVGRLRVCIVMKK